MPAKKTARQALKRTARNRSARTVTRTTLATAARSINSGDVDVAEQAVLTAISALDRAVQKGVLHKNNASRRKSRLSVKLNRLLTDDPILSAPVASQSRGRQASRPAGGRRQNRGRSG